MALHIPSRTLFQEFMIKDVAVVVFSNKKGAPKLDRRACLAAHDHMDVVLVETKGHLFVQHQESGFWLQRRRIHPPHCR
ncbi:MAG: hypothetical protein ACOVLK_04105, partial [Terrimicrobiaceae bacterium]